MTRALRDQVAEYMLQRISQSGEKWKTILHFLQLATQFFVARQVARRGCYTPNFDRNFFCNRVELQVAGKITSYNSDLSCFIEFNDCARGNYASFGNLHTRGDESSRKKVKS